MRIKILSVIFVLFLASGIANSEPEEQEGPENDSGDGVHPESFMGVKIIEGPKPTPTGSTLEKRDGQVQDQRCRWSVHELHNEGSVLLCQCLKCVCTKTRWLCEYHFKQCPFFHCGANIFSPITQKCCCGDIYAIKKNWRCCGYQYYDSTSQKCCPFSSLKQKSQTCPRSSV